MEDEEEDVKEVRNGHMMMGNGMVASAPHSDDDDAMEEDGDETMMNGQHTIPTLSFGTSSSSCSSSSSTSSFFNTNNNNINNDPFSSSPFQAPLQQQQARQVKTLPIRKRMPLGKTQSLPVDAFMNSMGRGNSEQAMMGITPDVFNAQDGF